MNILVMTIPVTVTLIILFVMIFLSAVRKKQFEDLDTPAHFPLTDDNEDFDNKTNNTKRRQEEDATE